MKLEQISAVLRPRSDAEAVDLGLAMVRRHAGGVFLSWFCLILPLWGLVIALLHDYPGVAVALLWWLKPLYDRVVLFYLGRALFGSPPTLREQVTAWPRLLTRRLGLALLWGRFSGTRSFTLPVVVLEGLEGKAWRDRTAVLKRHGGSAAFGLTQSFGLLEWAVTLGLWFALRAWLPEEYLEWFQQISFNNRVPDPPLGLLWSVGICYLAAMALLEPFYAGGGFGLYINSRTHLEGWDVDLAFRQLGSRLRSFKTMSTPPPLAGMVLAVLLLAGAGEAARAVEGPVDQATAGRQIREILTDPDFTRHVEKSRHWVPDPGKPKPLPPSPMSPPPAGWDWSWLAAIPKAVAAFFSGDWKEVARRLCGALLVVGVLTFAFRRLWKAWLDRQPLRPDKGRDRGPQVVMGLEVTPESLPDDVPGAAWAMWERGETAAAVRLLYRGALSWLTRQGTGVVRESDTEGDCLRHAGGLPEAGQRQYFAEITGTWLASAYGHSDPEGPAMEQLCRRWPFAAVAGPAKADAGQGRSGGQILILLTLLTLTGCSGHWEEKEQELGHQGEARRNPFLAATRFLEANQYPVLTRRGLTEWPDYQNVIIAPAEALQSRAIAQKALNWVRRGGHLIYLAEGGGHYLNDWGPDSAAVTTEASLHPLPATLGITLTSLRGSKLTQIRIDGQNYRVSLAERIGFDTTGAKTRPDLLAGPVKEAALASLRQGAGRVTLMAHAHAFRNRYIGEDDNAAVLLALMSLTEPVDTILLIKAGRVNLWNMLVEHAWPALTALGVLLAGWLWGVLPRFGPVGVLQRRRERRFAGHLDESGSFLWQQGLSEALLYAPRQAVLAAARRRAYREEERHFTALLATHAGLPTERVQDALYAGTPPDARVFTRQMADLQQLLRSLGAARGAA